MLRERLVTPGLPAHDPNPNNFDTSVIRLDVCLFHRFGNGYTYAPGHFALYLNGIMFLWL